ncbi:Shikimate kinase [Aliiroseovarius sp. xm-m-379]|uniref:shikimate kinase n=1 Tax=Aliiroseovarius TaxID=1658781 RepID=UPI001568B233|nr:MULTISPECIES: shikimate kinase [unclassified Aliiroseovarius]NRP11857.1 Shikimate kinase [Aliiroseovarius sp. xm-d-517]NRP26157.1 Shikimate kinase [Aliiroseovarius sp. xm-m-379]NRP31640.1 Shikimate kinase [Aliiroseovarius sp. xm-m-314]NRP34956.1 Shikimate kinase [Aliiroseovarius sp. xm-a-104]NRP42183.1 Shikimate kinase [Aliiroseovarius sp. xm-m-339-2]NRP45614.1 Shikimate kinase [Aliiroseovarius sp. xm-m-378]NRP81282.1 Shikimate kinase [Aliiroseovarius sp. xm-v-209]NRP93508.1 Shikimate ki
MGAPLSKTVTYELKKSVVMVGMMGAGKTAVGQALANRLGVAFLDSDEEIVKAANMSIAEIFERDGEPFFRDRESEVIARLLETERAVLSTGGGAFLAERNRDVITEMGVSVWLKADLDLLWNRVKHKDTRPLLRTADPKATLTEIYNARVPVYAHADLVVEARSEYAIGDMADAVIAALLTRPDVLQEV